MRFKINQKQYDLICERLLLNEQLGPGENGVRKVLDYFGVLESEITDEGITKIYGDISSKNAADRLGIRQLEGIGVEVRWGRSWEQQLEALLSDSKAMESILKSISKFNPAQASKITDKLVLESIGEKNYESLEQVYAGWKKIGGESQGLAKIKQALEAAGLITNENRYLFDNWKPKDVPLNVKYKKIFEPPPPKKIFVPSKGIPISSKDFNMISKLSDDIYVGIVKESVVQYSPKNGKTYYVDVKVFPFTGDLSGSYGYANTRINLGQVTGREVWINSTTLMGLGREEVQVLLQHEFTHIADPIKYKIKKTKKGIEYYSGTGERYNQEVTRLNKEVEELVERQNLGEQGLEPKIQALRDKIQYNFEMYMISPFEHTAKRQSAINNINRKANEILGNKMDNLRYVKVKDYLTNLKRYLSDKNALLPIEYQQNFGMYHLTYYEMIRNNPKFFKQQKDFAKNIISEIDKILKGIGSSVPQLK